MARQRVAQDPPVPTDHAVADHAVAGGAAAGDGAALGESVEHAGDGQVGEDDGWRPGTTWRVTALVMLILVGLGYLAAAWQLDVGTASRPDIGLFPRVAGLMFVLFLVPILISEVRAAPAGSARAASDSDSDADGVASGGSGEPAGTPVASWLKPLAVLGSLLFYVLTAPTLGHILSGAIVMAAVLRLVGRRPAWQLAVLAALCSLGSYLLIAVVLEMPLPIGQLGLEF